MNNEAQKVIAFVFKRSGKKQISYSDFYLTLSMELNWFTPDDAKKFLDFAIDNKFLIREKDMVQPNFDFKCRSRNQAPRARTTSPAETPLNVLNSWLACSHWAATR